MKSYLKACAALYADWLKTGWSLLTGRLPDLPRDESSPKLAADTKSPAGD